MGGPPVGGARGHVGGDAGALRLGGREQHLHRRQAAHQRQSRRQCRRGAVREAGAAPDGERRADADGSGGVTAIPRILGFLVISFAWWCVAAFAILAAALPCGMGPEASFVMGSSLSIWLGLASHICGYIALSFFLFFFMNSV